MFIVDIESIALNTLIIAVIKKSFYELHPIYNQNAV